MCFLLTLQGAVAAAALCAAWRRRAEHARAALAAAALVPPLLLGTAVLLLRFDGLLRGPERPMLLLLGLFSGLLWLFGFVRLREPDGRVARLALTGGWTSAWWIVLSLLLLGAFILTTTWVALSDFLAQSPAMLGAWRGVWMTLLGAVGSGGLVIAVALAGTLERVSPTDETAGVNEPLPGLIAGLIGAVMLRAIVIACSLTLWARSSPFGPRYFLQRLVAVEYGNMVTLRGLLGLILPLLFALLALVAWQGGARRQAAAQFLPVLILSLISEMLAAALTVGLGGVVF